jgi:hypothetical protein
VPIPKPVCRTLITASWKTPVFEGVAGTTAVIALGDSAEGLVPVIAAIAGLGGVRLP